MQKILVIEDEYDVRVMLQFVLTKHGFEPLTATDALEGMRMAYQHHPAAIILDVMMPGMDGLEACRRLKEMTDIPILILTGRSTSSDDIVKGFEMGADEYMTKPFNNSELISRLKVCLRRSSAGSGGEDAKYLFPAPSMVLDCGKHELMVDGETIHLSPNEFGVLNVLVRHTGHIFSPEAILLQAWGVEHLGDTHLVKQYVYQLRQKIEPDPSAPQYLHTVRGAGYYFAATEPD